MSDHLNPRQPTPHGFTSYSRCGHCGTWRPASGLVFVGDFPPACVDRFWCERQAKRPTGIDANGDAE